MSKDFDEKAVEKIKRARFVFLSIYDVRLSFQFK